MQEEDNKIVWSCTHPKYKDSVSILYFNLNKQLVRVDFNETADLQFMKAILTRVPLVEMAIEKLKRDNCKLKDISNIDLSFDKFWDVYGNKNGKKAKTAKKWNGMSREDKIMALGSVPRMKSFYHLKGYDQPYPETYINNCMWENEFTIN